MEPKVNSTQSNLFCPSCGQPLDIIVQPGLRRNRDTGQREQYTITLVTCWTDGCVMEAQTITDNCLTDRAELQRYGCTPMFDVTTGRAFESWECSWWHDAHTTAERPFTAFDRARAMSNVGHDTLYGWERAATACHGRTVRRD